MIPNRPGEGRHVAMAVGSAMGLGSANDRVKRLGLSPRQQDMNRLWSYYMCSQYAHCKYDWDGIEKLDYIAEQAISSGKYIPPGFVDKSGALTPIKFRAPTAPYQLCKVIVDRFTGLLFSEKRHPKLSIEADPKSEDFMEAVAEVGRLWPTMMMARTFGGACGSVAVGFQFLEGRPWFEVHNPIWTRPYFKDRTTLELRALERRLIFWEEVYNPEEERYVEVPFWHRRLIDENVDIVFRPVPVGDGEEPDWEDENLVDRMVRHDLGFCPAVWIQNMPVSGDIDGLPDCQGTYEMMASADRLLSQAEKGTVYTCDPTAIIKTAASLNSVKLGSDNAIKLMPGDDASFLEGQGTGPKSARELAGEHRVRILEVAQCFLEGESQGAPTTATEVNRRYGSMLSKADVMREQYGERGVKPLLEKVARAVKKLGGQGVIRHTLSLPPKIEIREDRRILSQRELGPGPHRINLSWPRYFEPSLQDIQLAVTAAAAAKAGGLIDLEHAIKFIQEYFKIEDVSQMMKGLEKQNSESLAGLEGLIGGQGGGFGS